MNRFSKRLSSAKVECSDVIGYDTGWAYWQMTWRQHLPI